MPNVFVRPPNLRKEADAAKAMLTVPGGDHLTMLNVYNEYMQSKLRHSSGRSVRVRDAMLITALRADQGDRNWARNNFLNQRALTQADNVRAQLKRNMEKYDIDLITNTDQRTFYENIRTALVCGFFMQVAHREGDKNMYLTVKDNQVRNYHGPVIRRDVGADRASASFRSVCCLGGRVAPELRPRHDAGVGAVQRVCAH